MKPDSYAKHNENVLIQRWAEALATGRRITPMQAIDERKLLIDAVTLLARNQAEAESAQSQYAADASRRMLTLERRCLELEQRLAALDERLRKLSDDVHMPVDSEGAERLSALRGEVERMTHRPSAPAPPAEPATNTVAAAAPPPTTTRQMPAINWQTLASSGVVTQDRAGLALMGLGAVAIVFAILTQVRF